MDLRLVLSVLADTDMLVGNVATCFRNRSDLSALWLDFCLGVCRRIRSYVARFEEENNNKNKNDVVVPPNDEGRRNKKRRRNNGDGGESRRTVQTLDDDDDEDDEDPGDDDDDEKTAAARELDASSRARSELISTTSR